jgi:NADH:ubiquinone oxidoreductase subunit 2 (subunit N)
MKHEFEFFFGKTILWLYMLFTSALVILIKHKPALNHQIQFEIVVFIAISIHCLILLLSCNSLLYICLFLAMISLCSLALCYNLRVGRIISLLYYFLSAIGNGFLLFGTSFIYFITGCENLSDLSVFLSNNIVENALEP